MVGAHLDSVDTGPGINDNGSGTRGDPRDRRAENTDTDYTSGIDWHTDWGASKFLSKQLFVGLVGYVYDQVTGDSGSGDKTGRLKSRVIGVGPQLGYLFPVGEHTQGYMNLKGYKEFDEAHRPGGLNIWLTFAFSPAAPSETTSHQ